MIIIAAAQPAPERLTESMTVRVTAAEKAAVQAAAREDAMTMSAWTRRLIQAAT